MKLNRHQRRALRKTGHNVFELRLAPVKLDAAIDGDGPKWIQVAAEGEFLGHPSGEFTLDAAVFQQIVNNLHAHPSYLANPGKARVIPFDFSHASEKDPTSGSLPVVGAPAQAWGHDLEGRAGADGKAQLWCLTEFLEPAKSYVLAGKYQWTSVTIWPNADDPKSGKNIGWYLSSVAFTNDPFIQGMVPIAASRRGLGGGLNLDTDYQQDTLDWILCELRWVFGLEKLASVDDIMIALAKLRSYCANPDSEPAGVDSDDLVCQLRRIFNLPTLATVDEVFAEADKLLVTLAEQASSLTMATKGTEMDKFEAACIALAGRLKVSLSKETSDVTRLLLDAVDKSVDEAGGENAGAIVKLKAIMSALGVQDPDASIAKIATLIQQADQLVKAMPELESLRGMAAEKDTKEQDDDVNQAMAYHQVTENARTALRLFRKNDKDGFFKQYPRPSAAEMRLSRSLATTPGGPTVMGAPPAPVGPRLDVSAVSLEMVEQYEGRNIQEKAISFIESTPAGKNLKRENPQDWDTLCVKGAQLVRQLKGHATKNGPANAR